MRKNPYIETDSHGYLLNPQYSREARYYADRQSRREEGDTTIWVHATSADVSGWLDPNFKIRGDRFYIGGGANADLFGKNLVFVKYKPTEIFDYDRIEFGAYDDFFECTYRELTSQPPEYRASFIAHHAQFMDEPEGNLPAFEDLPKDRIIELLKTGLATSNFSFFETKYVQKCLVEFGYTAYYESEDYEGAQTLWENINLAILPADFKNIDIVGFALSTGDDRYECPNCLNQRCSKQDILAGTLYKGTVLCEDCSKGAECSICDKLTPSTSVGHEEYDSWGDRSIICTPCIEDRRCEYCEEFFDPSEMVSAKRTVTVPGYGSYVQRTKICDGCFDENREAFDEEQDPRTNPSRERIWTQGRQNDGGVSREKLKRVEYRDRSQRLKSLKPNPSETTYVLPMGPEGLRLVKPMQLFHATVASSAVLESGGLRSREELGGLNMTGGGPDKSISMTGDVRVAEAVVLALVTTCRIAQGEITASELLDAFRRISPRGHSNFVSQKNAYKDIKNTKFKGYDLFNLYRDILMFGHVMDQTIYDPVLVSTDLSFFDAPSEDLINNICVLSCDLSTRARIVPRNHRFRQLSGQLNYVEFPINEFDIVQKATSSDWSDFRYKDGVSEYLFRGAQGHSLAVEIVHEPINGPVRTNVSYLEQMNEFRVWDSSLLSNYVERECGPDILESIQDRTGQDVFYPYFKELTIEDNLISSQIF